MTHLTPQQFIDAIDGVLSPVHAGHLEACEPCRQEIAALRSLTSDVRAVVAPEPSPLFWDHLSERVRVATSAEPVPAGAWWHGVWNPVMTIGLALAVMAIMFVVRAGPVRPSPLPPVTVEALGSIADDSVSRPPDFVVDVAASLPMEDLREVARPTPDATAALMDQLTPTQRAEFVRLVKARMNGAE
jgi:hypothetical protein